MAQVFFIRHEVDLSEYNTTVTDGGDLSQAAAAALNGSAGGMSCLIDDATNIYGTKNFTLINTGSVRYRFFVDPNGMAGPALSCEFKLAELWNSSANGTVRAVFYWPVFGTAWTVHASITIDSGLLTSTSNYEITDAPHCIEVLATKASTADANDGVLTLWIDGVLKETISNLDVYTNFAYDRANLGTFTTPPSAATGTIYLDEFILRDDSTQIGCDAVTTTTTTTSTTTTTTTTTSTTTTTTTTSTTSTTTTTSTSSTTTSTTSTSTTTTLASTYVCETGYQSTGLTLSVTGRIVGLDDGTNLSLQDQVESYSHTITAAGGYESASFTLRAGQSDIEDWLVRGVGRHVRVYDPSLSTIWEGFVDDVQGTVGPLAARRGPLTDVANRTLCIYSDDTLNTQAFTAVANNTTSQSYFGIHYKTTSGGQVSAANAVKIRDVFLADNAWPAKSQDVSDGGELAVTVNCAGYNAYLDYPYSEPAAASSVYAKLVDILAEEPNTIFSTDYSHIEANALVVPALEDQYRTGLNLVKTLVGFGGAADNTRRCWGVYAGRLFWYWTMPTTVDYLMYLSEGTQQIRTPSGVRVEPWNVLPGRWLQFADLLPNAAPVVSPYQDMRLMFIESVTYTAPRGLSLQGGRTDRLPQLLARQNMLRSI